MVQWEHRGELPSVTISTQEWMDAPMGPIPPYNAETIKAMEDVKEGKNIITIPLDELFDEECGKEKQPTDEELVQDLIKRMMLVLRYDQIYNHSKKIKQTLHQLIAEVSKC
jgi:hypothetical protein